MIDSCACSLILASFLLSSLPSLTEPAPLKNPIADILTGPELPVQWVIPHFLVQGAITLLVGEAGQGKSYLSYYLGLAVASGLPFLDFKTKPRRVVYFDQENSRPDRDAYLKRAWNGLGQPPIEPIQQNFWPFHFHLGGAKWEEKLWAVITGINPHLIIFDTANPCFDVEIENDNTEASRIVHHLRLLGKRREPDIPTMLILKHAKVMGADDTTRTVRGAKDWLGTADSVIFHIQRPSPPRSDGLFPTMLEPKKTRAYGLRQTVKIQAEWTDSLQTGLRLYRQT